MDRFNTSEHFDLPVTIKGREQLFAARLVQIGYTYKIFVDVDGQEITFEPDEERNFRAIIAGEPSKQISVELIRTIGEAIEQTFR